MQLDHRIYSCDDHLDLFNVPRSLWQERLPSKYREAGPRLVEKGGRGHPPGALADLLPQPREVDEIALELVPPLALARRAHDQAAPGHGELV